MQKRQFLRAAALAGAALPLPATAHAAPNGVAGPALLTVSGAIGKPNRGPFDPVLDQMMHKQKLSFDKAHAFDFAALLALPAQTIKPTLEYDGKAHTLRGPALLDVVRAAGAPLGDDVRLVLRAVDGYAATVTVAQARAQRYIVATHIDGAAMALGGLGPLWAMYDADRVPEMAARPLAQRYGSCPWALYHIAVEA
ncbi:molybdopterin-dependent oxidoreductase [Rugamonas sp.]|uniref:molybdopterin-dependent oxidoreductase n=1 Tax=Rugamonas sp. TaxID=1926287 RepID=UPI0025D08C0C|nr:molybdopterin-dependent oxidoreductase [Rugamonas sp.]